MATKDQKKKGEANAKRKILDRLERDMNRLNKSIEDAELQIVSNQILLVDYIQTLIKFVDKIEERDWARPGGTRSKK